MPVEPLDSIVAGSNCLLVSAADTHGKGAIQQKPASRSLWKVCSDLFQLGRRIKALPELTQYRDYRPCSMAFCAELHHGKVTVKGSPAGQDIARHLNRLPTHYRKDPALPGAGQGLRLLDDKHTVFYVQPTPAAAAVFKSSRPQAPAQTNPGRSHFGQVSGIYTTLEGGQFRLVDQQLFRFEPKTLSWLADKDSQAYGRIGLTREGALMKVPLGVSDMSVEGDTEVRLAPAIDGGTLQIRHSVQASSRWLAPISESGETLQVAHIGLTGDVLYASTSDGELLRGDLCTADHGCLKMTPVVVDELEGWHRGAVSFKGFMHDDDGQLNALLLDPHKQLHSTVLTDKRLLLPGWNLSDVMLKVIEKGLPEPGLQALTGAIDLGQRGKVALEGRRLLSWDPSGQRWDPSDQVDVEYLGRGLDGRAYVLQAGQLKALATHKNREPLYMGASYDLAPLNPARTAISLDEVMAGDAQRTITGFAVENGRRFVSLDSDNRLHTHIDGVDTPLKFKNPKAIQALALDHHAHLYAHTRAGELLRLDKADWQGAASSEVAWVHMALPDNERLKSLHMGADKHLVASWGENSPQLNLWNERYRQLQDSTAGALQWEPLNSASSSREPSLKTTLSSGEIKGSLGGVPWALTSGFLGHKTEGIDPDRGLLEGLGAHFKPLEGLRNMGLDIQHRFKGRAGLEGLYAADKVLRGQLDRLASSQPPALDMRSRLESLSASHAIQKVVGDLEHALALLEANSFSLASRLGDLHGMKVVPEMNQVASSPRQSASTLYRMRQAFDNVWPSTSSMTAALLRSYDVQGLVLSKWNPGDSRDLKNPTALIESDLIHHAQVLAQLSQLVTRLEGGDSEKSAVAEALGAIMQRYHDHPVHKKTCQNINGFEQAETLYHNFKLLAKDLGTPGSALNFHMARTLGLERELGGKEVLLQHLQQSGSGQSITPSREKSVGFGLLMYGIPTAPFLDFTVGISKAKANAVTISRTDSGANIEIRTNTVLGGKAAVGVGKLLSPLEGSLGGGVRVGAEAAVAVARDTSASVNFSVKEADFPKMMEILLGEGGDVYDLLDLGEQHTSGSSSKTSVDSGLSVLVQGRGHFKVLEGTGGLESLMRMAAGAGANLNLAHWDSSRAVTQGATQMTRSQGGDFQLFNKGGIALGAAPFNTLTGSDVGANGAYIGGVTAPDISFTVSFDRTITHAFSFTFKQPAVIEQATINELTQAWARSSTPFKEGLRALPQREDGIGEQLNRLQRLFDSLPVPAGRTEEQHALKQQLQDLLQQHRLSQEGRRALTAVESTVSYVGLKGDGQYAWMDDAAPANKAAIVRLFKAQPLLALMLNDLAGSKGLSVSIGLEVKPDVLRMIETRVADARDAQHEVERALKNKDNLRIKTLSVNYKASRTHSMGLPLPVLSFSSTASLGHAHKMLNTAFVYGADPDVPLSMTDSSVLTATEPAELNPEWRDQKVRDHRRPEF